MKTSKIRWGILGPGAIAHSFAEGLKYVKKAELIAVGSRSPERAQAFARKFNIAHAFGSYEELVSFADVGVVYIATPHSRHYEDMLLCLNNNKHVLCEKAFTINAAQAKEVLATAKQKKLFVMEAMWTLFMPVIFKLKELLRKKEIGEITIVNADLGFRFPFNPEHRVFNPHLGGGALLDIGVYPLSLTYHLFGLPDEIATMAEIGATKVDETEGMLLRYENGPLVNLYASLRSQTPSQALFIGTEGMIRLEAPIYRPTGITVIKPDKTERYFPAELKGNGYNYEAQEVQRCVSEGKPQSDIVSHRHTLDIMQLMDSIRDRWGLRYPNE